MAVQKVLIVEDEASVREVLAAYLAREGFHVLEASDGVSGLDAARRCDPDVVILDLMLPEMDGTEVCRRLRQERSVPILMLTARQETEDRILGLAIGADDYVAKPFNAVEVVLRVKAILRRMSTLQDSAGRESLDHLDFGDLLVDKGARKVTVRGEPVEMTGKEFDLLYFLASHAGQVLTRSQLIQAVWGYDHEGDGSTVTVHIRRLRQKIEERPSDPRYIETVWGVGYRFDA